jgi:IS5 family transposase
LGGAPDVIATGAWGSDERETLARLDAWNQPIHRVRARIEKIFGTWKRSYGLRRMRWRGLAKAAVQVHPTAIAYNLKRTLAIIAARQRSWAGTDSANPLIPVQPDLRQAERLT